MPHVQWPPASLEDEQDALYAVRNSVSEQQGDALLREFRSLFLDALDNRVTHTLVMSSFHEAVYSLAQVLDIGQGDSIVCSPLCASQLEDVAQLLGCTVTTYQVDPLTFAVDVSTLSTLIDETTRLVVVTHHWWSPAPLHQIVEQCLPTVTVVEDCSFGYGVTVAGSPAWTIADVAIFPLQNNSLVFAWHGCMLVTNNTLLHDCLSGWKKTDARSVEYLWPHSNDSILWPFQSVIGKFSLRHLNRILHGSRRCYEYLAERLQVVSYLSLVEQWPLQTDDTVCCWYRFKCWYDTEKLRRLSVEWLVTLLQSEGVDIHVMQFLWSHYDGKQCIALPPFYDWYEHKEIIDQYIAAFRKVQLNLFC